MEIHISVRNLVEFLMRSGDLDNRRIGKVSDNAMQEGGKIHRKLQRAAGSGYEAEVTLSHIWGNPDYDVVVEGRADGVFQREKLLFLEQADALLFAGEIPGEDVYLNVIDEIKGTYKDVTKMKAPHPVHLAQAMCYAFFYVQEYTLPEIGVQMTYCNMDSEEIRYFRFFYKAEELEKWYSDLMSQYKKWADFRFQWEQIRRESIQNLHFPYDYRGKQKELMGALYQTFLAKKKVFLQAPTGVGKTISTIYPALKYMGQEKGEKLFYLTAKTITRTVAADTFDLLRNKGLKIKTLLLTAKDKTCFLGKAECNPEACPYAKGHFDRINDALYGLLTEEDSFTRERIEEHAGKFQVCPYELALDLSSFSDAVVCDYNYLFDPHVYLKRFFEGCRRREYIFLIDEAHNLVERGREMYSATLIKEDILALKREIEGAEPGSMRFVHSDAILRYLNRCNKDMLALKKECDKEYKVYKTESDIGKLCISLTGLHGKISSYLEENEQSGPVREKVLEFYFKLAHFMLMLESLDENYRIYTSFTENGDFFCKLLCVNPSAHLRDCMERGISSVLFSATLLPIQYYKGLLGATEEEDAYYVESVFEPRKRGIFIAKDTTSVYTERGEEMYRRIAGEVKAVMECKKGNYMIFFPSYRFAGEVYRICRTVYGEEDTEWILQEENMPEESREAFLNRFEEQGEKSLGAFCIMGGIFSEGIDLKGDSLIGAIIVGNGLPQTGGERDILKEYFDEDGKGFDYAYKYPGLNKVFQAAGRVIRTEQDAGVVVLLERRFLRSEYNRYFPREWQQPVIVDESTVGEAVRRFWDRLEE